MFCSIIAYHPASFHICSCTLAHSMLITKNTWCIVWSECTRVLSCLQFSRPQRYYYYYYYYYYFHFYYSSKSLHNDLPISLSTNTSVQTNIHILVENLYSIFVAILRLSTAWNVKARKTKCCIILALMQSLVFCIYNICSRLSPFITLFFHIAV